MTESETIFIDKDPDFLEELSEYLDVLSSSTRLRILKCIESGPKDVRQISGEIETSYENTKKHLNKLMLAGVVKKEAGMSAPTSKGIHPVWKYSLISGGLETIIQNLSIFGNIGITLSNETLASRFEEVRDQISDELISKVPVAVLVGGTENGRAFALSRRLIRVGREDPDATGVSDTDIVLPETYSAVTRISRPHCMLSSEGVRWFVEDCGSTGGTYLNNVLIEKGSRHELSDGDLINLSKGAKGARLTFSKPRKL